MSGIEIIRYQHELKDAVADLWGDAFGTEAPERRRYLEWKYERNPYLQEPILFLAVDVKGRVVGTRGFHGTRWHTRDGNIVIPSAEDFAIAHEHRNTGLATAIMRFALEDLERRGFEYVMNASGGQVTVLHSLAMGWKSIGAMEPVARLARHERARLAVQQRSRQGRRVWRPRLARMIYRKLFASFELLDRAPTRRAPIAPGASIVVETSPRPAALADLAARLPFDGRIRHARDRRFFEWRFENPAREYRFLLYELDSRVEGYMAIVRSYPIPFHISDWEGTSHEIRAQLLEFAINSGRFGGLGVWTASLSDESKALLERSSFRPVELELRARGMPCVLLKKLGAPGDWSIGGVPALDPSHWDIRLIDSMHG